MQMVADVLSASAASTSSLEGLDNACEILGLNLHQQWTCITNCNTHMKEEYN